MPLDSKKVAIIGTSNALMREGWVNQTREQAVDAGWTYANRSIGGSSSLLGAYLIATDDEVRGADRVIVDFCINDQLFVSEGQASLHHVLGHYASMFISLAQLNALDRILVLMFPQQQVDHVLFDSLRVLFDRVGVRYIDFRHVIDDWLRVTGKRADEAYSDSAHFSPGLQRHIGELVLDRLGTSDPRPKPDPDFRRWLFSREALGLVDLDIRSERIEQRRVGTSVLQKDVRRFHHGDRFHVAGAKLFLAAHIWATKEAGVITVRGENGGIRVHLRRDYVGLFIFDSIFDPLPLPDRALVEVLNDRKVPFQRMRGQKSSIYDDHGSSVEIVSLIGARHAPSRLGAAVSERLAAGRRSIWQVMSALSRRARGVVPGR